MSLMLAARTYGTPLDWGIIVLYLLAILVFGSFFGRYSRTTHDFFFSGARFKWWLIGMSMVATGVGSHSFMKYAQKGYEYGLSSGMSYMNDWFFIPFFMFGWLPIIYFSRVRSIPEYFERRFGTVARFLAVIVLLEYMIGYIGFNLYTLGVAAHQILGVDVSVAIILIAVICGVYVTAGGQTAVIFTDLAQGFMLLIAGLALFAIGLDRLALDGAILDGLRTFWSNLSLWERLPFAHFNYPQDFNFVGVFWQDGIAGSITFLFISQGLIMRFLAAKSVDEGRKTILFNTVFILPLAMIVVGNAGWLGKVFVKLGMMPPIEHTEDAFVAVAEFLCKPGVFGFVLAALAAALMSTIDTYTNASAALFVYDIYQPYLRPGRKDRHYMRAARWGSAVTAAIGMGIGLWFATMGKDMYKIHGMFQAFVTPPIVAAVFLGAFWKRFTNAGAIAALAGGMFAILLSKKFPAIVEPFAHGVPPDSHGQYNYMTACFGLVCAGVIGVIVSLLTPPKRDEELAGLWIGSIEWGRLFFKGARPNDRPGRKVPAVLRITDDGTTPATQAISYAQYAAMQSGQAGETTASQQDAARGGAITRQPPPEYPIVRLSPQMLERLGAEPGDLLYVCDARWWLGGLRSLHCRAGDPHDETGTLFVHAEALELGSLRPDKPVIIEKIF